jgi:SAM-dependent methyltransferase
MPLPAGRREVPDLSTSLHVDMLNDAKMNGQPERDGLYGLHWGDPQQLPWLRFVRDEFLLPFVHPDRVGVEIGPGGGRWTRYLLTLARLYVVDFHQELLDELARNFRAPGLFLVKNTGTDFPLIELESVDLVFSFGVFVHLDTPIIESYLDNIKTIIRPGADVIIQYSDKTKEWARKNLTFSDNDPTRMCAMIKARGYRIVREDRDNLPHSSIVHFTKD